MLRWVDAKAGAAAASRTVAEVPRQPEPRRNLRERVVPHCEGPLLREAAGGRAGPALSEELPAGAAGGGENKGVSAKKQERAQRGGRRRRRRLSEQARVTSERSGPRRARLITQKSSTASPRNSRDWYVERPGCGKR